MTMEPVIFSDIVFWGYYNKQSDIEDYVRDDINIPSINNMLNNELKYYITGIKFINSLLFDTGNYIWWVPHKGYFMELKENPWAEKSKGIEIYMKKKKVFKSITYNTRMETS